MIVVRRGRRRAPRTPTAPRLVAAHFADPGVGGVQSLVRIYNRAALLARMQDIEFGVYGHLYQAGRNRSGTAGMGGNGQFNRLSALDAIADRQGPWRNRLTEDQDLGLRLLARRLEVAPGAARRRRAAGRPALRPLLRQRTRWSQGNLQAFDLLRAIWRAPFGRGTADRGGGLPADARLAGRHRPRPGRRAASRSPARAVLGRRPAWQLALFYLLAFGGTVLGLHRRPRRARVRSAGCAAS